MKAMILAAGEGTRLRPLTEVCPKALVPVANKPVLDRLITLLISHGVDEIIVNAHHHYQMVVDYLKGGNEFGVRVVVRVEKEILGTGGGIKNTRDFWDQNPFIVINGDILTDIDLQKVYDYHLRRDNLLTLVLHDFPVHNKIMVDGDMNILAIERDTNVSGALAFTGIQVINPEVLELMPENTNYSIVQCYKKLIHEARPIRGYRGTGHSWIDIGTITDYLRSNRLFVPDNEVAVDSECHIHPDATLAEWAVLGKRCTVEKAALVERSVLWSDVIVREGVRVIDSVVASAITVERDLIGGVAVR
jgi:mannose-1-phosphate guanylyltransferase